MARAMGWPRVARRGDFGEKCSRMHSSAHFVAGDAAGSVSGVFRAALPPAPKWLARSADCDGRWRPLSGRRWVSIGLYRCFSTWTIARMCGRIKGPLELIWTRGHRGLAHSRWRCHKTGAFLRDHGPVVKDLHGTGGSRSSGFGTEFWASDPFGSPSNRLRAGCSPCGGRDYRRATCGSPHPGGRGRRRCRRVRRRRASRPRRG